MELQQENARLKRLMAEAELDKAILREAASPNEPGTGGAAPYARRA